MTDPHDAPDPPDRADLDEAADAGAPARRKKPMVEATPSVTFRDFLIFQLKLMLDGTKDFVLFQVAIVAIVVDFISGKGKRPRLFYSVLRQSERFDLWLNLNGALEKLEDGDAGDDGLFGASAAGSDTFLGKVEQMVRGGDEPRRGKASREGGMRDEDRVDEP